jgi:hypothetical protein
MGGFRMFTVGEALGVPLRIQSEVSLQEEEAFGVDQRSASRPADVIQCSPGRGFLDTAGYR